MFRNLKNVLLAVTGTALLASSAVAATSGSVTLGGTVASSLEVSAVATAAATSLDLSAGEKIVHVADISMSTNNEQGLTLTATAGSLTKSGGSSIAFEVTTLEDGAVTPPATGDFVAGDHTVGTAAAGSAPKDLYIKYSPAALQDPGAYAGSITLTVTDN